MRPTDSALDPAASDFERLKDFLVLQTGLAYYAKKSDNLLQQVNHRMAQLGVENHRAYLARLEAGQAGRIELDALVETLTIGETYFFRNEAQFNALRHECLPDIIGRNRQPRKLWVWSAGCATGPEVYSLSILLKREFSAQLVDWDVRILGTDINRNYLDQARQGRFRSTAFRGMPQDLKEACFMPDADAWVIRPQYRAGVSFQYLNLVHQPFPCFDANPMGIDLILCRNVMIYFAQPVIDRLVNQFHQSLVPGGWLMVGHAESNTKTYRNFKTVHRQDYTIYQKDACQDEPTKTKTDRIVLRRAAPTELPLQPPPGIRSPVVPSSLGEPAQTPDEGLESIIALANRGDWQAALTCCRQCLAWEWSDPPLHFFHGLLLEQMGDDLAAKEALGRALYLDPHFASAHYHLGLLCYRRGEGPQAVRWFRNVLGITAAIDEESTINEWDGLRVADMKALAQAHLERAEGM